MAATNKNKAAWPADAKEVLHDLFMIKGWSAGLIAKHLGRTRNATISKINRFGFRRQTPELAVNFRDPKGPPVNPTIRKYKSKKARYETQLETFRTSRKQKGPTKCLQDTLVKNGCHWMEGDPRDIKTTFCNQPSEDGIWCSEHRKIVYLPRKTKNESNTTNKQVV